jgi:phosphoglycolate phosphatase-like HAD superfamily hydrolase
VSEAVAVDLDGALGDTRPLWRAFLDDAARRFAAIAALDPRALPEDRAAAAAELDRWAAEGIGDWRKALERFAADHAPIYLRPDPAANAALRALASRGCRVGVYTDAPVALARIALAHLGLGRRVDALEAGAGSFERVRARYGAETRVARSSEELLGLAAELGSTATRR